MKIESVLLCMLMRDNEKCNISHVPYLHRLEGYSILNTKRIGVIDPEGPEQI